MREQTTPAMDETDTQDTEARPDWAGAMAQIDAEIAELQALLRRRRGEAEEAGDDVPGGGSAA